MTGDPIVSQLASQIVERGMRATRALWVVESGAAYTEDPVFKGLRRNRVNAELLGSALRLPEELAASCGYDARFQDQIVNGLLATQRPDGSWHEVHPRYDEPSALVTSFVGTALVSYLLSTSELPAKREAEVGDAIARAARYVQENELRPGYFLKSRVYRADHLNVDVSCGAFLADSTALSGDETALEAASRAVENVITHQFENGAYPYTTGRADEPYPYPLNRPCIHYQGVTAYYLGRILERSPDSEGEESLQKAAGWLSRAQREDGHFDWGKSHLPFVWYLSAAYAFGAALFMKAGRAYQPNAVRALRKLDGLVPALAHRWEDASPWTFPSAIPTSTRAAWTHGTPLKFKALGFGHGLYRELARRRFSETADDRTFRRLMGILGLRLSTVDPNRNYPDLFVTSEILDSLSGQSLSWEG